MYVIKCLLQHYYDTPLSKILCDHMLCWCLLHKPIWLVILLIPWWVCGHNRSSLHFPGTHSHNWVFPECPCCIVCDIYSRPCYFLWTNGFRLTDNVRLFPSLYFKKWLIKHQPTWFLAFSGFRVDIWRFIQTFSIDTIAWFWCRIADECMLSETTVFSVFSM